MNRFLILVSFFPQFCRRRLTLAPKIMDFKFKFFERNKRERGGARPEFDKLSIKYQVTRRRL